MAPQCGAPFSLTTRCHHCRSCGLAFCDACSSARLPLAHFSAEMLAAAKLSAASLVRVCDACAAPFVTSASSCGSSGGTVTLRGGNLGSNTLATLLKRTSVFIDNSGGGSVKASTIRALGGLVSDPEHVSLSFVMPPGVGRRQLLLEGRERLDLRPLVAAQHAHDRVEQAAEPLASILRVGRRAGRRLEHAGGARRPAEHRKRA